MRDVPERQFTEAMWGIHEEAKRVCSKYRGTRFVQMLDRHGGVETARRLLYQTHESAGLTTLWECGRLDLTSEALILNERFSGLFTDEERQLAEERLRSYGYDADRPSA